MTVKFKRKRLLLSEKNKNSKAIGYARASNNEFEYLEEQIKKEQLLRRKLSGNNLGGRPKISPLKESLVISLIEHLKTKKNF